MSITSLSFRDYQGLSKELIKSLDTLGYEIPTKIQQEVIPVMLSGQNVLAKAPTGSGKTAAFGIPVCNQVEWEENAPQVLILEPTRELTDQVRDELFYIGRYKRLKVIALFGGFPIDKQIQTLKQKSHIIVGTPGRLMDHIRRDSLKLNKIKQVVIDEADLMLDMGFADDVRAIIQKLSGDLSISLFSATLKPEVYQLVDDYTQDAVTIMCDSEKEEKPQIEQRFYETNIEQKYNDFIQILKQENPQNTIIFCGTREMVKLLFQKLRKHRIFCGMLHGEMEQRERLKTVDAFRRGGFKFLIATDVAARGIDFEEITHVINYDFPEGQETYVHRIGRTGRNGKSGTAISFVCERDNRMFDQVKRDVNQSAELERVIEVSQEVEKEFWQSQRKKVVMKAQKGDGFKQQVTRLGIGGGRKAKIRTGDIVATICSIDGVNVDDIGIIDIRDSMSYVEILNQKGEKVLKGLLERTLKGKVRKVRKVRS